MTKINGIEFNVDENGEFIIKGKIPENPPLSSTEKNYLLITTKGNKPTNEQFHGKDITLSINAYCEKFELPKKSEVPKVKKK